MPQQPNFQYFTYVDDNGTTWNKRGELDPSRNAIDGSAALTAGAPVWRDTPSMRVRRVIMQDPATFRTKTLIIYTAAAFAAITGSTTAAFPIEGTTISINYALSQKIGEKQPVAKPSRNLEDHA